jgi:hypothetical protein
MAIQDFISGGFYGKVGDFVGQRWHNKRYVRKYVKPTNPNTPAQQTNRALFAKATKLAQLAFNINKGDPSWDTTAKGEFSLRVGTARNRLKVGLSDTDALPLYPDGFNPSHTLESPAFAYSSANKTFTVSSNDPFSVRTRTFGIVIYCQNVFTNKWEDVEYTNINGSTDQFSFSWTSDGIHAYPPGSTFTAATTDDATHSNASILFPSFAFQQTEKPTMLASITWGNLSIDGQDLQFNPSISPQILGQFDEMENEVHIYSLHFGGWDDISSAIVLEEDGTCRSFIELGEENQARAGSYLYAGNWDIDQGAAFITISWPYRAFQWP